MSGTGSCDGGGDLVGIFGWFWFRYRVLAHCGNSVVRSFHTSNKRKEFFSSLKGSCAFIIISFL